MRPALFPHLAFAVAGLAMLLAAGFEAASLIAAERTRRLATAEAMLEDRAALLAERLGRGLERWFSLLQSLAARQGLAEAADPAALMRTMLAELAPRHPDLVWLGLMDGRGVVLAGSDPSLPLAAPPRLAARALAQQGLVMEGPHDRPGGPALDFAIPVGTRILAAQLGLGWARELREALERPATLPVLLELRGPEGPLRLAARPREPLAGEMISASAPMTAEGGPPGWSIRAMASSDAVLAGLPWLALRLGLGTMALALLAGQLAARAVQALGPASSGQAE